MSEPSLSFERILLSKLYQIPPAGNVGWAAYMLGSGDTPPDESSITVDQAFNDYSGHYLFAPSAPTFTSQQQADDFATAVQNYISSCFGGGSARACVWLLDANAGAPKFGPCQGYAFSFASAISGYSIQSNFNNPIGLQLTFAISFGAAITSTASGLRVFGSSSVSFITSPDTNMGPTVAPSSTVIPFTGPYAGCFMISGAISTGVTLDYFGTGVQYAFANSDGSGDSTQFYPLLVTGKPGTTVNYVGAIDPLNHLNTPSATVDTATGQLRTLLMPVSTGGAPPSLASWLRTPSNQAIALLPQGSGDATTGPAPNSGAFVFAASQPIGTSNPVVYITLAGDYALGITGSTAPNQLLCGLFGTEAMSFRPYTTDSSYDVLRFVPGNAAYAPVFPFPAVNLNNPQGSSARLTSTYQTSWGMMMNGSGGDVLYLAQPEGSSLFAHGGASVASDVALLDAFPTGTALDGPPGFAVPLAPYAGVATAGGGFKPADLQTYESQIIAAVRKETIAKLSVPMLAARKEQRRALLASGSPGDGGTTTTTPQGLLAIVEGSSGGSDYVQVTLGQSAATPEDGPVIAFYNLDAELQSLFQTNQLFSVIVNPAHLGKQQDTPPAPGSTDPTFQNIVDVAGYRMAADVGVGVMATDYRNVMIMKFCQGTVRDRVTNPNQWGGATEFSIPDNAGDTSVALTGLAQWLQGFIDAALVEANDRNNGLYKNFARIVTDPNWNGILVLRADVRKIPEQIAGLAAGIDFTQFEAHHFGVTVSRVVVDGGVVSIAGPSSIFGLIDYQYPLFRQNVANGANPDVPLGIPVDGPYGFTVLQLQALFINTALADFQSRVQLTTNEIFSSKVTATYGSFGPSITNAVVLKGSYQAQGTTATYVFEQTTTTVFILDSNIFNAISFTRVQFNTLTADSGGSNPSIVSRFLIWGAFDFTTLPDGEGKPYDTLSFGTAPGTAPQNRGAGLAFSNLQIQMTSPVATPNSVTYDFDARGLGFDLANSRSRAGSLFPTFALQIDSFIASDDKKRPSDYGYLVVRTTIPSKELAGPWFGVAYKVTMGTPGALVSGAGFESRMLLAWGPGTLASDTLYAVFTGLQLPGAAPGAKLLSLQGVLKVAIASIQLTYDTVAGSNEQKSFNLRLNNVGLKFLGIVKLPPGATINFFLFGDPNNTGSLGWYAAYIKNVTRSIASAEEVPLLAEEVPLLAEEVPLPAQRKSKGVED